VDTEELLKFVVTAKARTYVGDGGSVGQAVDGEHSHTFTEGPFCYRDRYVGGTDFCGQEVVWEGTRPVWAMVYSAALLRRDVLDGATAGRVIKAALSALYVSGRFLGGWTAQVGEWYYLDKSQGDVTRFTGSEEIRRDGVVCYRLEYAGGLVNE
jgi:hypothetical protein